MDADVCGTQHLPTGDGRQDLAEQYRVVVQFWRVVHQGLKGGRVITPMGAHEVPCEGSVKIV